MTCSLDDWISMDKPDGLVSGRVYCKIHLVTFSIRERCPLRASHPMIADGKVDLENNSVNNFDKQLISNDKQLISNSDLEIRGINVGSAVSIGSKKRKYDKKNRSSIWERFHNHGVKFDCIVDWGSLNYPVTRINKWVSYKRLDFDSAIVKVFKKSILITLRSSAEIIHDDVRQAEIQSINKIVRVLDELPVEIKVSNPDVVNLHNAFVNHPAALYDVRVQINGEDRLISDRSNGNVEFEAINPKHAVADSILIEEDGTDKGMLDKDYAELLETQLTRKVIAENLNALIQDRKYYAENLKSHVKSVQDLGNGVSELTQVIKELKNCNSARSDISVRGLRNVSEWIGGNALAGNNLSEDLSSSESFSSHTVGVEGVSLQRFDSNDSRLTSFSSAKCISYYDMKNKTKEYNILRAELLRKESGWGDAKW